MNNERSAEYFSQAQQVLVGGVSSSGRDFTANGVSPLYMVSGNGSCLVDADGNNYIDYVASYGSLLLGHAHPEIVSSLKLAIGRGTSLGASSRVEVKLAKKITEMMPSIDKVRFVNSHTEATMSAVRLARGITGREKIVKFAGCYHGHADMFLADVGEKDLTSGVPSSAGVTLGEARNTLTVPFNNIEAVGELFAANPDQIAAVIVEPVPGFMGVIEPQDGFLAGLRQLTTQHGALLIFDETLTGFRLGPDGAQGLYGVSADITCLGKSIGAGLPVGAIGGSAQLMDRLSPLGPVVQSSYMSANPLAMIGGLTTLDLLNADLFNELEKNGLELEHELREAAIKSKVPVCINRVGSMMSIFFTDKPVTDLFSARQTDRQAYGRFFRAMLAEGIYIPASPFEAWFVSAVHSRDDIDKTVRAMQKAIKKV